MFALYCNASYQAQPAQLQQASCAPLNLLCCALLLLLAADQLHLQGQELSQCPNSPPTLQLLPQGGPAPSLQMYVSCLHISQLGSVTGDLTHALPLLSAGLEQLN